MKNLLKNYNKKKSEIKSRLNDFSNNKDIFYELCFCLLTPQSSAKRADSCIKELKKLDFLNKEVDPTNILKQKIRFHNNKTKYLLEAKNNFKEHKLALKKIKDSTELRDYFVNNVKGYGLKESSHFLRNIGYRDLAILDRHILKNLVKFNIISSLPQSLTTKKYLEIENKFKLFSSKFNIPIDELDLLFWSLETGEIFK
jgi:N-glycosylase/DNA lyase